MAGARRWLPWARRGRDLECIELVELVSAYLDDELSRSDRRRVQRHLAACDGCDRYVEQMRVTRDLLGTVTHESLDDTAVATLLEAFRGYRG